MRDFACKAEKTDSSIAGMLGELKEILEYDNRTKYENGPDGRPEDNHKSSEDQYFTFLGSSEKNSISAECNSPLTSEDSEEKLGQFFKIKSTGKESLSSKLRILKHKSCQGMNESLKRKISEKIFNLWKVVSTVPV